MKMKMKKEDGKGKEEIVSLLSSREGGKEKKEEASQTYLLHRESDYP